MTRDPFEHDWTEGITIDVVWASSYSGRIRSQVAMPVQRHRQHLVTALSATKGRDVAKDWSGGGEEELITERVTGSLYLAKDSTEIRAGAGQPAPSPINTQTTKTPRPRNPCISPINDWTFHQVFPIGHKMIRHQFLKARYVAGTMVIFPLAC